MMPLLCVCSGKDILSRCRVHLISLLTMCKKSIIAIRSPPHSSLALTLAATVLIFFLLSNSSIVIANSVRPPTISSSSFSSSYTAKEMAVSYSQPTDREHSSSSSSPITLPSAPFYQISGTMKLSEGVRKVKSVWDLRLSRNRKPPARTKDDLSMDTPTVAPIGHSHQQATAIAKLIEEKIPELVAKRRKPLSLSSGGNTNTDEEDKENKRGDSTYASLFRWDLESERVARHSGASVGTPHRALNGSMTNKSLESLGSANCVEEKEEDHQWDFVGKYNPTKKNKNSPSSPLLKESPPRTFRDLSIRFGVLCVARFVNTRLIPMLNTSLRDAQLIDIFIKKTAFSHAVSKYIKRSVRAFHPHWRGIRVFEIYYSLDPSLRPKASLRNAWLNLEVIRVWRAEAEMSLIADQSSTYIEELSSSSSSISPVVKKDANDEVEEKRKEGEETVMKHVVATGGGSTAGSSRSSSFRSNPRRPHWNTIIDDDGFVFVDSAKAMLWELDRRFYFQKRSDMATNCRGTKRGEDRGKYNEERHHHHHHGTVGRQNETQSQQQQSRQNDYQQIISKRITRYDDYNPFLPPWVYRNDYLEYRMNNTKEAIKRKDKERGKEKGREQEFSEERRWSGILEDQPPPLIVGTLFGFKYGDFFANGGPGYYFNDAALLSFGDGLSGAKGSGKIAGSYIRTYRYCLNKYIDVNGGDAIACHCLLENPEVRIISSFGIINEDVWYCLSDEVETSPNRSSETSHHYSSNTSSPRNKRIGWGDVGSPCFGDGPFPVAFHRQYRHLDSMYVLRKLYELRQARGEPVLWSDLKAIFMSVSAAATSTVPSSP